MKRKTILSLGLCAALCLPLCGCGKNFDLNAYETQVSESQRDILVATNSLAYIARAEARYWKHYIAINKESPSYDDLMTNGYQKNLDTFSNAVDWVDFEPLHDDVMQQYKNIKLVDVSGDAEAREVQSAYLEMYDSFIDYYDLVTSPAGSYVDFVSNCNTYFDGIISANKDLELWLDDSESD